MIHKENLSLFYYQFYDIGLLALLLKLFIGVFDEVTDGWISEALVDLGEVKACHEISPVFLHQISHHKVLLHYLLDICLIDLLANRSFQLRTDSRYLKTSRLCKLCVLLIVWEVFEVLAPS